LTRANNIAEHCTAFFSLHNTANRQDQVIKLEDRFKTQTNVASSSVLDTSSVSSWTGSTTLRNFGALDDGLGYAFALQTTTGIA